MKHLKTIFLLAILSNFINIAKAQLSEGGIPVSFQEASQFVPEFVVMPPVNNSYEALLESKADFHKKLKFAKPFSLNITPKTDGQWLETTEGKIWLWAAYSPNAFSLNLIFENFNIPPKAKLFIYNEERTEILGAFTNENVNELGTLAVAPLRGDKIIVEYYEPNSADFNGNFTITQLAHDYIGVFRLLNQKDGQFGLSEDCQVDINCDLGDDHQVEKHSVCRIIISGMYLCSGALINNQRMDATPYFLTANHCVEDNQQAGQTVFYFNYESPSCDGVDGSTDQTLSGALMRATISNIDFALLEIIDEIPTYFYPYFAGWNATEDIEYEAFCIHHPMGDVKKISYTANQPATATWNGTEPLDPNTHWKINDWTFGATEGGSSGSPLFDINKRIIGDLTGGSSNCAAPYNDYFSKISSAWNNYPYEITSLKPWLDPDDTGILILNGFDPQNIGIQNSISENSFSVYPNPVNDVLEISSDVYAEDYTIKIFDITGKNVFDKSNNFSSVTIRTREFSEGIYFLQITTKQGNLCKKISVIH